MAVTRPLKDCGGESLGFLPGAVEEKVAPYMMPYQDVLTSMVGRKEAPKILETFDKWPLAYIRGRTIGDRMVGLMDEGQNATIDQLRAYTTRIGTGGRLFITGDCEQSDLIGGGQHLEMVASALESEGVAGVVRFTDADVVRSKLIEGISRAFRKIKGQPIKR